MSQAFSPIRRSKHNCAKHEKQNSLFSKNFIMKHLCSNAYTNILCETLFKIKFNIKSNAYLFIRIQVSNTILKQNFYFLLLSILILFSFILTYTYNITNIIIKIC